jgi:hypothetical protein
MLETLPKTHVYRPFILCMPSLYFFSYPSQSLKIYISENKNSKVNRKASPITTSQVIFKIKSFNP